jgi:hypothetical protein
MLYIYCVTQNVNLNKGEPMTKSTNKSTIPAISQAAGLAARAIARLEANAAAIHAEATNRRGFQAVSSRDGFSAIVRHGKTVIEIQGDDFAVRQTD